MYCCKHQTKCVYICRDRKEITKTLHTHTVTHPHTVSQAHTHTQAHNIHTQKKPLLHTATHTWCHSLILWLPLPQPSHTPPPPPPPYSVHRLPLHPPPSPFSLPLSSLPSFPPLCRSAVETTEHLKPVHQGTQFKGMGGVGVGRRNHTGRKLPFTNKLSFESGCRGEE